MSASDFECEGVDKSPVCPGFLARSVLPSAGLIARSVLQNQESGITACSPLDIDLSDPCPKTGLLRATYCRFGEPCSPCYRMAHQRVDPTPRFDPCAALRCEPCYPAVNTAPNLPTKPLSSWRPAPPAVRPTPESQLPAKPCLKLPYFPCPPLLRCEEACVGRNLPLPPRGSTLNTKRKEIIYTERGPCFTTSMPVYTCSTIGTRKANDRVTTYYNYSGYIDVPGSPDATCTPLIPCYMFSNHFYSGVARRPIVWKTSNVNMPPRKTTSEKGRYF